jgi:hypothetical protein
MGLTLVVMLTLTNNSFVLWHPPIKYLQANLSIEALEGGLKILVLE